MTVFDGETFENFTEVSEKVIMSIAEDRDGKIWFGTWGGGLYSLNKQDRSVSRIRKEDGLLSDEITSVVADAGGNLWIAGLTGAVKYGGKFRSLTHQDGLVSSAVRSVIEDSRNNVWIGSEAGGGLTLFDFEEKVITRFTKKEGLGDDSAISLAEDRMGNIWVGSLYGCLVRLEADRKHFRHFTESGTLVTSVLEDKQGNIWYSSQEKGGVFRIDKNGNTKTHFTTKGSLSQQSDTDLSG